MSRAATLFVWTLIVVVAGWSTTAMAGSDDALVQHQWSASFPPSTLQTYFDDETDRVFVAVTGEPAGEVDALGSVLTSRLQSLDEDWTVVYESDREVLEELDDDQVAQLGLEVEADRIVVARLADDGEWVPELTLGFYDEEAELLDSTMVRRGQAIRAYGEESLIVTVCSEPLFATKWIVPRLHRFYAVCPDAEVRLQASLHTVDRSRHSAFGVIDLKRAGIDVSVRLGYGHYADITPQRLMGLELLPMCAPELASSVTGIDSLRQLPLLCDSTLTRFDEPCGWKEWFKQQGCEAGVFRELRFGNGLLAQEAAVAGQGVLLGSRDLHQAELSAGKLEVALDRPLNCEQAYYVVSAGPGQDRPIAEQFLKWLLDEASKPA